MVDSICDPSVNVRRMLVPNAVRSFAEATDIVPSPPLLTTAVASSSICVTSANTANHCKSGKPLKDGR